MGVVKDQKLVLQAPVCVCVCVFVFCCLYFEKQNDIYNHQNYKVVMSWGGGGEAVNDGNRMPRVAITIMWSVVGLPTLATS